MILHPPTAAAMHQRAIAMLYIETNIKGNFAAFGVAMAIAAHLDEIGRANVSLRALHRSCGAAQSTIVRAIRWLEANGHLQVDRDDGNASVYRISTTASAQALAGATASASGPETTGQISTTASAALATALPASATASVRHALATALPASATASAASAVASDVIAVAPAAAAASITRNLEKSSSSSARGVSPVLGPIANGSMALFEASYIAPEAEKATSSKVGLAVKIRKRLNGNHAAIEGLGLYATSEEMHDALFRLQGKYHSDDELIALVSGESSNSYAIAEVPRGDGTAGEHRHRLDGGQGENTSPDDLYDRSSRSRAVAPSEKANMASVAARLAEAFAQPAPKPKTEDVMSVASVLDMQQLRAEGRAQVAVYTELKEIGLPPGDFDLAIEALKQGRQPWRGLTEAQLAYIHRALEQRQMAV